MIEVWKPVPGYEGIYSVSDQGRVRSEERIVGGPHGPRKWRERILEPKPSLNGYYKVSLRRGGNTVHRTIHSLVAETFIGPYPGEGYHVCHNDGNRTNNARGNLRYDTEANNHADTIKHGTSNRGAKAQGVKLREEDIPVIRELRAGGQKYPEIAAQFGVSAGAIQHVVERATWAWVE